jgi:hypothetical protein
MGALMRDLFSDRGIGLSFLRQPMGASDFAVNGNYSYDDMPPSMTDPTLAHFPSTTTVHTSSRCCCRHGGSTRTSP